MHSVLYLFPLIRKEGKRLGVHCLSKGFLLFKFSPGTQELEHPPPPNPLPQSPPPPLLWSPRQELN